MTGAPIQSSGMRFPAGSPAGAAHPHHPRPGPRPEQADPQRSSGPVAGDLVSAGSGGGAIVDALDGETGMLVAVAAVVAGGSEVAQRDILRRAVPVVRAEWIEEVILQSYLFAGFPRALNAMRIWRAVSGLDAPTADADVDDNTHADWTRRGEATCAAVYGHFYDRLRVNIAALHPALDAWMVSDGYGMVLGRPALDLARRELCVVAACVAAQQDRQLHSHLHGALHVGAAPAAVAAAVDGAIAAMGRALDDDAPHRYRQLWLKVLVRHEARLAEVQPSTSGAADTPAPGPSSTVPSAS